MVSSCGEGSTIRISGMGLSCSAMMATFQKAKLIGFQFGTMSDRTGNVASLEERRDVRSNRAFTANLVDHDTLKQYGVDELTSGNDG